MAPAKAKIRDVSDSCCLEKPGGMIAVECSDPGPVSGNYHEQEEPSGVILASAKAKIRHLLGFRSMADKITEIGQVLQKLLYSSVALIS